MNVLTINAAQSNGTISVSGTTDAGMLAVAISVYDKTGTNLIKLETTSVSGGTFSHEIEIIEGEYQICVADYEGGECKTTTVTVAAEEDETVGSPDTGYETIEKVVEEPAVASPSANATSVSMAIAAIALVAFVAAYFWAKVLKTKKTPR